MVHRGPCLRTDEQPPAPRGERLATETVLPLFVKSFALRYARYRNKRRHGTGKLFEERYLCYVLNTDLALGIATTYVDLNPVRAGMVAHSEMHRWSTARRHMGLPPLVDWPAGLWKPSPWYQGLADSADARATAYGDWLAAAREPEYVDELREVEALSSLHYSMRLRRPNGTRAAERSPSFG